MEAAHVVGVRRVVRGDVIDGAARGEAHTGLGGSKEERPTFGPFSPISERKLSSNSQHRSQKRISGLILLWM